MIHFEAIPKKHGNSWRILIPSDLVKKEKIKPNKEVTVVIFKYSKENQLNTQ